LDNLWDKHTRETQIDRHGEIEKANFESKRETDRQREVERDIERGRHRERDRERHRESDK
jgi:hypothetical protein